MTQITKVPLLDLKAQYHTIRTEVDEAIRRVVDSQVFVLGPEVSALESVGIDTQYCRRR